MKTWCLQGCFSTRVYEVGRGDGIFRRTFSQVAWLRKEEERLDGGGWRRKLLPFWRWVSRGYIWQTQGLEVEDTDRRERGRWDRGLACRWSLARKEWNQEQKWRLRLHKGGGSEIRSLYFRRLWRPESVIVCDCVLSFKWEDSCINHDPCSLLYPLNQTRWPESNSLVLCSLIPRRHVPLGLGINILFVWRVGMKNRHLIFCKTIF